MKRLAIADVDHHTEEILQALGFQGVERNFPRMFFVKGAKVLIGDPDGVVATLFSVITGFQPAPVDPALNRLGTAMENCSEFFPASSLPNPGTYSGSIADDEGFELCP